MESSNTKKILFDTQTRVAPLGLISMNGTQELGRKINNYLVKWGKDQGMETDNYLIETDCPRFSSGDGKGLIKSTVRGNDLFILCDVGNYSCTYNYFGMENAMSPDDHYQDLKRIIQAASGKAHRINVIMPSLYGGRQHRRSYRESLDCAVALQELEAMGVENILTFDAHDPRVQNAVPLMGFDNIIPSYQVLKAMFKSIDNFVIDKDHFMIVSPDEGAINRNMYYASVLGVDLGMFYKRRDYSVIINGRNPIIAHEYLGNDVTNKDVFIADDIISSGESMLEVAVELKKRKAKRIFAYATYAIFTNGLETFDKAYADGIIDGVFGTNLTYRTPQLLQRSWFHEVDCAKYISYFIASLNHDLSISNIIDPHQKIEALLKKYGQ
ncbi:ribose-phosphate pyrophosphokinase [Ruminococcus sp. Marseille-P6503]|uniref:ribose-phosphate pyrophosphokinase n=1 Tax=Ruminococcus sp. Marseille-P6503 TaxID=2364796 RepID=UPI000F545E95|nr:ribose-phosphate pyrophosphokinase [Ruminococcus sp. Marseille-P6503]